jgi:hypothetical protein
MFLHFFVLLSSFALADDDCYKCFNSSAADAANLSNADALKLKQYWDPINKKCGSEKNDQKRNLIFKSKEDGIPKTWILHPVQCGSKPLVVDLAQGERDWVLAQLSVGSQELKKIHKKPYEYILTLQQCIDQKWSKVADGQIKTSQANPSQFSAITNVVQIERELDYEAKSMKNSNKHVKSGPLGVYWADIDDELVLVWRGTATQQQLITEVSAIAAEYFSPVDNSFVDVKINDIVVGGAFNYFYSNFMDLWTDETMEDFKTRAKDAKKIRVIGHSLGGALASIASMFLAVEQNIDGNKIELVTFGEPRLSDSTFSINMNTLIKKQQRYVYYRDLVPHVPPYKDAGMFGMKLYNPQGKQSAFHHASEVYLLEDFQLKQNPNFSKFHSCGYDDMINEDDQECSNKVQNIGSMTDIIHIIDTIKNDKEAAQDHINYWPQYSSFDFCFDKTATTTTSAPVERVSDAPVQSTTSAPVESTTSAPVESITDAPVEMTTDAPVETTTDAPVEKTTAAPHLIV